MPIRMTWERRRALGRKLYFPRIEATSNGFLMTENSHKKNQNSMDEKILPEHMLVLEYKIDLCR